MTTTTDEHQSNDLIEYLEGATVGDMLDFLSKELIRLRCEQTLHLFAYLADRRRSHRQAKETGNRTKILERQKIIDQAFEQVEQSVAEDDRFSSHIDDLNVFEAVLS